MSLAPQPSKPFYSPEFPSPRTADEGPGGFTPTSDPACLVLSTDDLVGLTS